LATAAELEREIAATRGRLQADVVQLRRQAGRAARVGVVVAAVAVLVVAGVVAWKLTRPPTFRERLGRLLPRRPRLRVPSMRFYVADERVLGEDPTTRETLVLRVAEALGTAAGAAAVGQIWSRLTRRDKA